MKEVHTNDVVTICKILARPFLRLYKTGKYDWPRHAVVIIIVIISILITKQASSCFSACFVESRKSVFWQQRQTLLKCWTVLNGFEQCWTVLKDVERCWMVLNSAERFWTLLNGFERCWTVLNGVERCWTVLSSAEWCWKSCFSFYCNAGDFLTGWWPNKLNATALYVCREPDVSVLHAAKYESCAVCAWLAT